MKLINCPACSKAISAAAASCPACGQPLKKKQSLGYIAGVFLLAIILIWVFWDILHSQSAIDSIK